MSSNKFDYYLYQDFSNANYTSNCDLRYVSRNLLNRGVEEAQFRYMLSDGQQAEAYKRLKLTLLKVIDGLDTMITEDGAIIYRYRHILRQALVYARYLIAIEREETASQFEMLEARLRNPRGRYLSEWKRVA